MFMARGCTRDVEIAGCPIHAGTRVITGFASANRDERVFEDADSFRVDRANAEQHLSFGFGPHVCPGATLARIEAREGVRMFLDRFPPGSVRLAPDFVFENVPTYFERGPRRPPGRTGVIFGTFGPSARRSRVYTMEPWRHTAGPRSRASRRSSRPRRSAAPSGLVTGRARPRDRG